VAAVGAPNPEGRCAMNEVYLGCVYSVHPAGPPNCWRWYTADVVDGLEIPIETGQISGARYKAVTAACAAIVRYRRPHPEPSSSGASQ
jgi:hypothetical protein